MEIQLGSFASSPYGLGVALAALTGVIYLWLAGRNDKPDALSLGLCVIPCALVCARLLYCFIQFEYLFLVDGPLFLVQTWRGGFMLWGAMLGGAFGALALSKATHTSTAATFDRLVCPAMAAIFICRIAEVFTTEGRGLWLEEESLFCRFPFAVQNEYGEWQLAVFLWEAAVALLILLRCQRYRSKPGDRTLLMLILYSACQIVFESLRMDSSLRFGFVSASQLFSGIILVLCIILRALRNKQRRQVKLHGLSVIVYIGLIVATEFAIDKSPLPLPVCYGIMVMATLLLLWLTVQKGGHLPHGSQKK